jgi:peptide deformylase
MAIRNILHDNDPFLAKKSREVDAFNGRLHILLDDMRQTMLDVGGIGLAAPQVGVLRRVVLISEIDEDDETGDDIVQNIIELINPEIIEIEGTQTGNEACLSVPERGGIVTRPRAVKVRAQDRHGSYFELICEDTTARVVCHEVDHLNGILYTDIAERMLTQKEMDELEARS